MQSPIFCRIKQADIIYGSLCSGWIPWDSPGVRRGFPAPGLPTKRHRQVRKEEFCIFSPSWILFTVKIMAPWFVFFFFSPSGGQVVEMSFLCHWKLNVLWLSTRDCVIECFLHLWPSVLLHSSGTTVPSLGPNSVILHACSSYYRDRRKADVFKRQVNLNLGLPRKTFR